MNILNYVVEKMMVGVEFDFFEIKRIEKKLKLIGVCCLEWMKCVGCVIHYAKEKICIFGPNPINPSILHFCASFVSFFTTPSSFTNATYIYLYSITCSYMTPMFYNLLSHNTFFSLLIYIFFNYIHTICFYKLLSKENGKR